MIQLQELTKHYRGKPALDAATATIRPGLVTGFIGPNGAGKSTTMRLALGLARPTSGQALINGACYTKLRSPLREVGAALDGGSFHPRRTALDHLRWVAATHGIHKGRALEVAELTGLGAVARKRAGGFSLGMRQRLAIAAALIGDPGILILDEPFNGLDPDGVIWVRDLLRRLAAEGRTVFLSSHLMSELTNCADHIIVLGRGRILADEPLGQFVSDMGRKAILVRSEDSVRLAVVLEAAGATVVPAGPDVLEVAGLEASVIAATAAAGGLKLSELREVTISLEEAYLALTRGQAEYKAGVAR